MFVPITPIFKVSIQFTFWCLASSGAPHLSLEYGSVFGLVISRHHVPIEAADGLLSACLGVDCINRIARSAQVLHRLADVPRLPVLDQFGDGSEIRSNQGRSTAQGLHLRQSKWLLELHRVQEGLRPAVEVSLDEMVDAGGLLREPLEPGVGPS